MFVLAEAGADAGEHAGVEALCSPCIVLLEHARAAAAFVGDDLACLRRRSAA